MCKIKMCDKFVLSKIYCRLEQTQPTTPFYGHYAGQPVLVGVSSKELGDFVGAKFYCPHALADENQHIRIRV